MKVILETVRKPRPPTERYQRQIGFATVLPLKRQEAILSSFILLGEMNVITDSKHTDTIIRAF